MGGTEAKMNLFSEYGYVAYQFKLTMGANILPTDTPLTLGLGQKVKPCLFLKVVMLHIKLKGIEHRAP